MKRVNYEDITLAGRHQGVFLLKNVEAVRPRQFFFAETS
jgi:hypothetical protein